VRAAAPPLALRGKGEEKLRGKAHRADDSLPGRCTAARIRRRSPQRSRLLSAGCTRLAGWSA